MSGPIDRAKQLPTVDEALLDEVRAMLDGRRVTRFPTVLPPNPKPGTAYFLEPNFLIVGRGGKRYMITMAEV